MSNTKKYMDWVVGVFIVAFLGTCFFIGKIIPAGMRTVFGILCVMITLFCLAEFIGLSYMKKKGVDLDNRELRIPIVSKMVVSASVGLQMFKYLALCVGIMTGKYVYDCRPKIISEMQNDFMIAVYAVTSLYCILVMAGSFTIMRIHFGLKTKA